MQKENMINGKFLETEKKINNAKRIRTDQTEFIPTNILGNAVGIRVVGYQKRVAAERRFLLASLCYLFSRERVRIQDG